MIENAEISNIASAPDTENMPIHGDSLLALKALESRYAGQVKCIYIDPPYNVGAAFEHYDDNLEHSLWLALIRPRLQILWNLLHNTDGSIWISIEDNEQAYMRVRCDELFGRNNFVAQMVWQKRYSREIPSPSQTNQAYTVPSFIDSFLPQRPHNISRPRPKFAPQ